MAMLKLKEQFKTTAKRPVTPRDLHYLPLGRTHQLQARINQAGRKAVKPGFQLAPRYVILLNSYKPYIVTKVKLLKAARKTLSRSAKRTTRR